MKPNLRYWVLFCIILGAAFALHAVSHGEPTLPIHPLSSISLQISGWQGRDEAFEEKYVQALGVTDWVLRSYQKPGVPPIGLYIGFYRSQRTGATIHSPKNCLPGAGWQPVENRIIHISASDGSKVPVNLYVIQKGMDKQVVLYWYQSHGRVVASEYWGKFYLVADAIRLNRTDAAIIRIVTPMEQESAAQQRAVSFAENIIGQVNSAIPK